jgi:large subunit ribosomal protein L29
MKMKAADLNNKSVEELNSLKIDILKEQFNLRMQKGTGQMAKSHLFKEARRNVARIETVLTQKSGAK